MTGVEVGSDTALPVPEANFNTGLHVVFAHSLLWNETELPPFNESAGRAVDGDIVMALNRDRRTM